MGSLIFRDGELHVFISKWLVRPGAFFAPVAVQQLRLWVSSRPRFCGYEHSDWFEVPDEIINRLQADWHRQCARLGQQVLARRPRLDQAGTITGNLIEMLNRTDGSVLSPITENRSRTRA